jgi:hypothetical protein
MIGQKPILGQSPDWSRFPQPSILWLFNEGSGPSVYDLSGNWNTGALNGNTYWAAGNKGAALVVDGTGDYIECSLPSNFAADMPITIVVKAKQNNANLEGLVNIQAAAENAGQILTLYLTGGNQARTSQASDAARDMATVTSLDTNKWNQYTCTHRGGAAEGDIYVNGVLANGTPISDLSDWGANVVQVGKGISSDYDFTGSIEYAIIFNQVLNATQIAQLYINPFPWFVEDDIGILYPSAVGLVRSKVFGGLADRTPLLRGLVA